MRWIFAFSILVLQFLVPGPASASGWGRSLAPAEFFAFCAKAPGECRARGPIVRAVTMTAKRWAELQQVNREVNATIDQVSDMANYGKQDVWTIPANGRGDCEDIALLKRQKLIRMGWPSSVLLMSVARDRQGEGHAILTVATSSGDLALDNRTSRIVTDEETGYYFYARQSSASPLRWVALAPDGAYRRNLEVAAIR